MRAFEQPLLAVQQLNSGITKLSYRPLMPEDFQCVKAAHAALFPIDYDDAFFHKATNGLDRIWSCAAFAAVGPYGEEQLVGFITAKTVFLHECEVTDRQHMGLLSPVVDHDLALYILTLGVLEGFRGQGIATSLIQAACQRACETRCRALFLHVITYNTQAMALYTMQGFACVARLSRFYFISTGRQPDPNTQVYDAYLYVQYVGGAAGLATPWDMLTLAWSPLRSALARIHSCMPGFCRQQQLQQQYPAGGCFPESSTAAAAAAGEPSRTSSESVTGGLQQQQQDEHEQEPMVIDQPQLQQQQQRQHDEQQQQYAGFSRPRYQQQDNAVTFGFAAAGGNSGFVKQQRLELLPPLQQQPLYPQHWQPHPQLNLQQRHAVAYQQQQHQQQHLHSQNVPYQQQQQRPPPQRMLRWLFNGQSRSMAGPQQQQQQQQQRLPTAREAKPSPTRSQ